MLALLIVTAYQAPVCALEKPLHSPWKPILPLVSCDVCTAMSEELMYFTEEARKNATGQGLKFRETNLFIVTDSICRALTPMGAWLRQFEFRASKEQEPKLFIQRHETMGVCQRSCFTAMEACNDILLEPANDDLTATLFHAKTTAASLHRTLCKSSCKGKSKKTTTKDKAATASAALPEGWYALPRTIDATTLAELQRETFEQISDDRLEVEELLERTQNGRGDDDNGFGANAANVLSRDEVKDLQAAIRRGDREAAAALDPSIGDYSDEAMKMLQEQSLSEMIGGEEQDYGALELPFELLEKARLTSSLPPITVATALLCAAALLI